MLRIRARTIVEIGVGMGQRSLRLIDLASRFAGDSPVRYAGIDLFEARPAIAPGMTLKRAHRIFSATGAKVRLIPGDPSTALARSANMMANTDLVVIAADQDPTSVAQGMFYLPRMLHADSRVFMEEPVAGTSKTEFHRLLPLEIARLSEIANTGARHKRVA
jgi:hypothetical protein